MKQSPFQHLTFEHIRTFLQLADADDVEAAWNAVPVEAQPELEALCMYGQSKFPVDYQHHLDIVHSGKWKRSTIAAHNARRGLAKMRLAIE